MGSSQREPSPARLLDVEIRDIDEASVEGLIASFSRLFADKTPERYRRYLEQHEAGDIDCLVAWAEDTVAGYLTIVWDPSYPPLRERGLPDVKDLNVLPTMRRRGIASRLLDVAEHRAGERAALVGIGVGLHPGYNAAQRLYGLRGYVPDGHGVTYNDRYVAEDESVRLDDDLLLHLEKDLR